MSNIANTIQVPMHWFRYAFERLREFSPEESRRSIRGLAAWMEIKPSAVYAIPQQTLWNYFDQMRRWERAGADPNATMPMHITNYAIICWFARLQPSTRYFPRGSESEYIKQFYFYHERFRELTRHANQSTAAVE